MFVYGRNFFVIVPIFTARERLKAAPDVDSTLQQVVYASCRTPIAK